MIAIEKTNNTGKLLVAVLAMILVAVGAAVVLSDNVQAAGADTDSSTEGMSAIEFLNLADDNGVITLQDNVVLGESVNLKESLTIAGRIFVCLHASSTAPDTDFTAKLVDVYPDGRAFNIANGILRARYRNSMETPELLKPGEVCEYKIDLWSVANCFLPGHRIRLEIAGSDFPEFSRNNQTGGSIAEDSELRIARQMVYHDKTHLSRLILPVIP